MDELGRQSSTNRILGCCLLSVSAFFVSIPSHLALHSRLQINRDLTGIENTRSQLNRKRVESGQTEVVRGQKERNRKITFWLGT
jgi:hypothetical protein